MAVSDDLNKLSQRAKTAENHAAAARNQARGELERTVADVRASAEAGAKNLEAQSKVAGQEVAEGWADVQRSWNARMAKARKDVDRRKAEFNASNAESRADWADADAELAIDYAYSAIEEAEYAVLDAILARRDAEEAAAAVSR
jgi:hypothetical protein